MQYKKNKKNAPGSSKLKDRKRGKKDLPYDVLYGAHPIIEMLKAKRRKLVSIYTTKPLPKAWDRIKRYLPDRIPNTQYVSREILSSMAKSQEHMGIVALTSKYPIRKKPFDPKKHPFILILDSIQDVHNLGAILRSAYCIGVDGVVICQRGAAPLTAAVFKTSAGLAEHLEIYQAPSLKGAIFELKRAGYNFYMAVLENGKNALEVEYKKPMCLVIGSEATGIAKDVRSQGELITLPQRTPDISYNAAVAAGIFMFTVQHGKKI